MHVIIKAYRKPVKHTEAHENRVGGCLRVQLWRRWLVNPRTFLVAIWHICQKGSLALRKYQRGPYGMLGL